MFETPKLSLSGHMNKFSASLWREGSFRQRIVTVEGSCVTRACFPPVLWLAGSVTADSVA